MTRDALTLKIRHKLNGPVCAGIAHWDHAEKSESDDQIVRF